MFRIQGAGVNIDERADWLPYLTSSAKPRAACRGMVRNGRVEKGAINAHMRQ